MNVESYWRITHSPASSPKVLVDYGDELERELNWPMRLGLTVKDLIDSDEPFMNLTGNNVVTLSFTVFSDTSLDTLARRAVMESLLAVAAYPLRPLKVEISGITDRYWLFAQAAVSAFDPLRFMEAPTARTAKTYSITASGFSQVGP